MLGKKLDREHCLGGDGELSKLRHGLVNNFNREIYDAGFYAKTSKMLLVHLVEMSGSQLGRKFYQRLRNAR